MVSSRDEPFLTVVEERNRLRHCFLEEESPNADENNPDPAGNLGQVPVGAIGAVLMRERMAQIRRESNNRTSEAFKEKGRKIAEMERQGFAENDRNEGVVRSFRVHK